MGIAHAGIDTACWELRPSWRWLTLAWRGAGLAGDLPAERRIGSEFLPHLDEGAIWVRGTLAPSTGQTEGIRLANQARDPASFPEVRTVHQPGGPPDDGTDTTGFFNTEYFVDLKPEGEWRPVFHQDKEELIAAMNRELEKIPGVIWNFSQPISDNMEEAVSGVKGRAGHQIYGDDLKTLEARPTRSSASCAQSRASRIWAVPRDRPAQPELHRGPRKAARYQINVADVQDAIQTAVGGNALTQVLQGEQRYDLVLRYLPQYRDTKEAIENIRLLSPSGERVSLAQLCDIGRPTALRKSIAKAISATWPSNTACADATWAARWKKPSRRSKSR
jgi:heavy metal efflux system protein